LELRPSLPQARVGKALSEAIGGRNQRGLEYLHETSRKIEKRDAGLGSDL
jgi:hypothetical protein